MNRHRQGLDLDRGGGHSRLCPCTGRGDKEGQMALLSQHQVRVGSGSAQPCGFSQNGLDWNLARILKKSIQGQGGEANRLEAEKGFLSFLFQMYACMWRPGWHHVPFPIDFQLLLFLDLLLCYVFKCLASGLHVCLLCHMHGWCPWRWQTCM